MRVGVLLIVVRMSYKIFQAKTKKLVEVSS